MDENLTTTKAVENVNSTETSPVDKSPTTPLPITPQPSLASRRALKRMQLKRSREQWFTWLGFPLVFLIGLGVGWLLWGQGGADTQVTLADQKRYSVTAEGNPTIGSANAPITLIEFSDYQCPFCVRWYNDVYKRLLNDYKDKIRFVYRDFPLYSIHPNAESAAEAADCAGEQNAYWQYHDALFSGKNGLGAAAYVQYATELGLNVDQFNKCISENRFKSEVDADVTSATALGVSSTPTFFLNGMAIVGAQPYEVFKQVIDKELAGAAK